MTNSTLMVFSILSNVQEFISKEKDINLFKLNNIIKFKRAKKFFIENSKRIYNDIENGYYSLKEFAIYLLFKKMLHEKINLYNIKSDHIIEAMKLFTVKKLEEDLKLLSIIHKELKFKNINDFFKLKEDGTNIAYHLIINKKISPIFFIRNLEKFLTDCKEDVIFNKEYEQFKMIANKIKETLKGGSSYE